MREGLLVIDADMRVVASNQAAHQLFTLYEGKLESQRLTELTRQPAVLGAFLGALKGEERSGVNVETHGPDRRIFDLRVVPLKGGRWQKHSGSNWCLLRCDQDRAARASPPGIPFERFT